MPGKNPAEAVREYIQPLQRSLSCLSKHVLRPSGYDPDLLHVVTLSETSAAVLTGSNELLHFSFLQQFSVVRSRTSSTYHIRTRSYFYSLEDRNNQEIIAFHWHPEETEDITFPHLHICAAAGHRIRQEILDIHFRTDRLAFEEFCQLMIAEFAVIPEREEFSAILNHNLKLFKDHRSW